MDNLKTIETDIDLYLDPNGGIDSVKVANHNALVKAIIEKVGKYTGFPFIAKQDPTTLVNGVFSWGNSAMNNTSDFVIKVSKLTADLNDVGLVVEKLNTGDIIHFKDYQGKSALLLVKSITTTTDDSANVIYEITVSGHVNNLNYTYQSTEENICMIEFVLFPVSAVSGEDQTEATLPLVDDYSDVLPEIGLVQTIIDSQARVFLNDGNEYVSFSNKTGQEVIDSLNNPNAETTIAKFTNTTTGETGYLPIVLNNPNGNILLLNSFSYTSSYGYYYESGFFYEENLTTPVPITATFPIDGSVDLEISIGVKSDLLFQQDFNKAMSSKKIYLANGLSFGTSDNIYKLGGGLDEDTYLDLKGNIFEISDSVLFNTNFVIGDNSILINSNKTEIRGVGTVDDGNPDMSIRANYSMELSAGATGKIEMLLHGNQDGLRLGVEDTDYTGDVNLLDVSLDNKAYRYNTEENENLNISDPNDIPNVKYVDDAVASVGAGIGEANVQSDYEETDTASDSFIQNLPSNQPLIINLGTLVQNGYSFFVYTGVIVVNGMLQLSFSLNIPSGAALSDLILTLPDGYRPMIQSYMVLRRIFSTAETCLLEIDPAGDVTLGGFDVSGNYRGTLCVPVA